MRNREYRKDVSRSDDIDYLVDKVQAFRRFMVRSQPYELQMELEHELDSYGYLFIIERQLQKKEAGYLKTSMQQQLHRLLNEMNKRRANQVPLREDMEYSPDKELSTDLSDILERLDVATKKFNFNEITYIYTFVSMVCRGSLSPVWDTVAECQVSRKTIDRVIQRWREYYGQESEWSMPVVRTLKRFKSVLRLRLRRAKARGFVYRPGSHRVRFVDPSVPEPGGSVTAAKDNSGRTKESAVCKSRKMQARAREKAEEEKHNGL